MSITDAVAENWNGQAPEMLQAATLTALRGIHHAFFTRKGGVSEGIYASLNGGIGSRDVPANVAENRRRMAAALLLSADHLVTAYQGYSSTVAARLTASSNNLPGEPAVSKTRMRSSPGTSSISRTIITPRRAEVRQ